MKRVLIFSLAYHPKVGGAEIAIKEITDRMSGDIAFDMVTMRWDTRDLPTEQIGNIRVFRIGTFSTGRLGKFLFQFFAFWKARELHREHGYDGVWAVMAHSAGVPAALFKSVFPHVPFILTLQEGDPPEEIEHTMRPLWPFFKRAFTVADTVQAISNFLGTWAARMGYQGRVTVIPNGVDVEKFALPRIAHEGVVLVTASRLVKKNGIDTVIRALPLLSQEVVFHVYGSGTEEQSLKKLADELGVSSRVHFFGHVAHEKLPEAFASADIFVRPSRSEGMGNAFIEAMAAGLPVIATQVGGIVDFLFDAKRNPEMETTGWAVDVDIPEQIADMVNDITKNPDVTERVVRRARMLVRHHYDWSRIALRMKEEVFSRL